MSDLMQPTAMPGGDDDANEAGPAATSAKRRPGRPKGSKNKPKKVKAGGKKRPGRPKGSKNKPKPAAAKTGAKKKRKPGRPKGSKNKPKAVVATSDGRRGRRPSPITGEKMAYVGEMLSRDATLSMNAIKPMITKKFGSMLAHEKLKEAYDEWMRAHGYPVGGNGRRRGGRTSAVGRRAADKAAAIASTTISKMPQFFVAVRRPERHDVTVTPFSSERDANGHIYKLVIDNGVSLNSIGFYALFQPAIDINVNLSAKR